MNALVIDRDGSRLDLSVQSLALRVGLLLFERTYAIGSPAFYVEYDKIMTHNASTDFKIEHLKIKYANNKEWHKAEEVFRVFKQMKKKKRLTKPDIVFKKSIERLIDKMFAEQLEEIVSKLRTFGLSQLAEISNKEDGLLNLWAYSKEYGEYDKEYPLSMVLRYLHTEETVPQPDVMVLFDKVAEEATGIMTHKTSLANLPNLNRLSIVQLLGVRNLLKDLRQKLADTITVAEADEHGNRYYSGTWNHDQLERVSTELQQQLVQIDDLKWAIAASNNMQLNLSVGIMDTANLWKLLERHDLLPPDTQKVLNKELETGVHCPHIPILALVPADDTTRSIIEKAKQPQALKKRKTIDLS